MGVMKNEGSSSEIPSVRKCHRLVRPEGKKKEGIQAMSGFLLLSLGALTPVAAPNVSPNVFLAGNRIRRIRINAFASADDDVSVPRGGALTPVAARNVSPNEFFGGEADSIQCVRIGRR